MPSVSPAPPAQPPADREDKLKNLKAFLTNSTKVEYITKLYAENQFAKDASIPLQDWRENMEGLLEELGEKVDDELNGTYKFSTTSVIINVKAKKLDQTAQVLANMSLMPASWTSINFFNEAKKTAGELHGLIQAVIVKLQPMKTQPSP